MYLITWITFKVLFEWQQVNVAKRKYFYSKSCKTDKQTTDRYVSWIVSNDEYECHSVKRLVAGYSFSGIPGRYNLRPQGCRQLLA